MIDIKRKLKNFGPLEFLVLGSLFYVITMLIWTASTRASVQQKANDIKSNHKMIIEFVNDEINKCSSGEVSITSWGENCNSSWNSSKIVDMEKFIFTNGSADHAANILTHLGVYDLFGRDKVFDIKEAGYVPKPEAETFDLMVKKFNINPKETIYIEDIAKNLSIGYERGCTTVWLINDEHFGKMDADKDFISHKIENLSLFLKEIRLLKSQ